MTSFSFAFNPARIAAGQVKFVVQNSAAGVLHELIIYKTNLPIDKLPVNADGTSVDEDSPLITKVGAVEDVDAGASGSMTMTLAAGHYVYICNIAGHYRLGMAGEFTLPVEGFAAFTPAMSMTGAMGVAPTVRLTPTKVVTVSMTDFAFKFTPATIRAGTIKFIVKNDATAQMHEIFLVKTVLALNKLPLAADGVSVDEDSKAFTKLGVVEDIEAGQSGEMIVNLAPGRYLYFCNKEAHFKLGMAGEMIVIP